MRHVPRAALALLVIGLLVAGSLLLAVLVAYWLFVIGGFTVLAFFWAPPAFIFLGVVVFPLLSADVRAVRGVRRTGGLPAPAELVSPADARRLRKVVADVADAVGTAAPDHVWLTPYANASVHEVRRIFRRPRRVRHMCVGVPLLVGLTTEELRAVLCHELGHHARRHSPFSNAIYRGSSLLGELVGELDHAVLPVSDVSAVDVSMRSLASVQRRFFLLCLSFYNLVTLAIRRRQEFEADRVAAEVVGADVMGRALISSHAVAGFWDAYRTGVLDPLHAYGRTPDDPYEAFGVLVSGGGRLPRVVPPGRGSQQGSWRGSWWDSHPPLDRRLAALGWSGAVESVGVPAVKELAVMDSAAYSRSRQAVFLAPPPTGSSLYRGGSRVVRGMLAVSAFTFFVWPLWAYLGAAVARPVLWSGGILALVSALILFWQGRNSPERRDQPTTPLARAVEPIPWKVWLDSVEPWQTEAHPAKLRIVIDAYNAYRAREGSRRFCVPTFGGLLRVLNKSATDPRGAEALVFAERSAGLSRDSWGRAAFAVGLDQPLPRLAPPPVHGGAEDTGTPGRDIPAVLLVCTSALIFGAIFGGMWLPGLIKWAALVTMISLALTAVLQVVRPARYGAERPRRLRRWLNPAAAVFVTFGAVGRFGQLARGEVVPWVIVIVMVAVAYPLFDPRARVGGVRAVAAVILAAWTVADAWNS
ncbi:M48 family metalloprotease [Streptomyces roseirectus]|uniref:M48 family metalloprotease n=1 Tax=Streptomyces roseirectus TaxID=2768066 RepID=A0A7H0IIH2_9ACTN|nr:M48 family metallopeptidase [Streptomyces roseirectus]QNP72588.1 M48 family metalloprotease [Streptomyces roseirectus]